MLGCFIYTKKLIMETYNISKDLLNKIFLNLIRSEGIKNNKNKISIGKILLKNLHQHSIEHILHLTLMDEHYEPLAIGDHFKMKPIKYDISKYYEPDVLCDMGLSDADGNIFGYVTGDTSWLSTDYSPFYNNITVKLYYHNDKSQVEERDQNVNPLELFKIHKKDIPYFSIPLIEEPEQLTLDL